jgi:prepilin peptidase CpaA
MIVIAVYIFLIIELLAVSYLDLKYQKISNVWPVINVILFILFCFIFPASYQFSIKTFAYTVTFFAVGFIFFLMKIMGGGDSKYLATFYLLVPIELQDEAFLSLLNATIIIASTMFIVNIIVGREYLFEAWREKKLDKIKMVFGKKFAYAPLILVSWIWFGVKNYQRIYF